MIRVGYIGDSPFINSGFGTVANALFKRMDAEKFQISVLGTMYQGYPTKEEMASIEAIDYYMACCIHDLMGFKTAIDFIQAVNPDVLFFIGDPGSLRNRFSSIMLSGKMGILPAVTYFPLEGAPLNPHIVEQARMVHGPVTYTKWGADLMQEYDTCVDYVWHGVDHADFRQYDKQTKDYLRKLVGWDDKFVVGLIGVNKRTNRQPVMIEAAKLLKEMNRDVLIYLHCQEQGEMFMGGWELGCMIDSYDVTDRVILKPNQGEHKYIARPRTGTLEKMLSTPLPMTEVEKKDNLAALDFVSLLNCFDLYLDPASAHGFNLPAAEAARCAVPVATVDDCFARTEIFSDVAYMMMPTANDYWHTGAVLPLVSPKRIVDTIIRFMDDPEYAESIGQRCKEKFDKVIWQPAADLFSQKLEAAHQWGLEMTHK